MAPLFTQDCEYQRAANEERLALDGEAEAAAAAAVAAEAAPAAAERLMARPGAAHSGALVKPIYSGPGARRRHVGRGYPVVQGETCGSNGSSKKME